LAAACWVRPFVTQDGPAHVYNAHILVESLRPGSPFERVFETRWAPVPNWAGHLVMMGLVALLPPLAAERAMIALTLVGVSASALILRIRVSGRAGECGAALYCALLGLNATWLFGFHSFLLGACAFSVTLAAWWVRRDQANFRSVLCITALLVLSYFCHLVSLGLVILAMALLAAVSPSQNRVRQLIWAVALPVLLVSPLYLCYRRLSAAGGAFHLIWHHFANVFSLSDWAQQLGWVDPITLGSRWLPPFAEYPERWAIVLQPVAWMSAGLLIAILSTRFCRERRGWLMLSVLLVLAGVVGPDSFGSAHGDYLPQRVLLLGLICLAPALDFAMANWRGRLAACAFVVALGAQSAYVWDYALTSERRVGELLSVHDAVGTGQRVGTLVIDLRGRLRPNMMLHADSLLGVGTGNVIWSNYEAAHYYFPVHFRKGVAHPPDREFEELSKMDDPRDAKSRQLRWQALLDAHRAEIDRLVTVGSDDALDAITRRWYREIASTGRTHVWARREP
jgi:hypothetical protein